MDQRINILFVTLLAFKNFYPLTALQHQSLKYDSTKTIQNAINGILRTVDSNRIYNFKQQSDSAHNSKLENMIVTINIKSEYMIHPSIHSNFITNETHIIVQSYSTWGEVKITYPGTSKLVDGFSYFPPVIRNVSIKIIGSSEKNSKEKFVIDFPSDFGTENYFLYLSGQSSNDSRERRKLPLKKLLEPIIIQHMKQKFVALSKNISDDLKYHSRKIFTSSHPNLSKEPQQYYYLVPNTSYFCFNLRNITIRGLTNFVSLNKTKEVVNNFDINLAIKNILGELILDYGSKMEKPIQLNFTAEDVFIRVNQYNNSTNVEIQNYRVFQTGRNISLTNQQSTIIIQHIESAIASSLMPSMTIWRTDDQLAGVYDMQSQFGKIFGEVVLENFNSIKHSLRKWIPFNEHQTDTYLYNIQFQNITIKLISGNSNVREIQCELPNSSKLIHDMNAAPLRKFHCNSNKGDDIDINFQANFTSINFSQITPNSSSSHPNNYCELQLENNENIKLVNFQILNDEKNGTKVDKTSMNYFRLIWRPDRSTVQNPDLKLMKKIDKTLISMAKERFVRNIKHIVCFPFEVCSQAATIANDFFLLFTNELLKNSSLR